LLTASILVKYAGRILERRWKIATTAIASNHKKDGHGQQQHKARNQPLLCVA